MDMHIDQTFDLNPDGSGKVALRLRMTAQGAPGDAEARQAALQTCIAEEVSKAKGVAGWSGLACDIEDDHVVFQGTAYFKDLSTLRLHCTGFHLGLLDFNHRVEDGAFILSSKAQTKEVAPADKGATDKELRKRIEGEREKLVAMRGFLGEIFGGLSCHATVRLPGKIGTVKNWKKAGTDGVALDVKGEDLLNAIDKLSTDDALLMKLMRQGGGPEGIEGLAGAGPLHVIAKKPLKARFDYESEAAEAAQSVAAMQEVTPMGPTKGPPLANARIVAVKMVLEADSSREINPMGQNYTSFSVAVCGDLPGPAVSLKEGRLDRAIVDTGESLADADEWKRRINWPKLSNDRTSAIFDFELALPTAKARRFREIAGSLVAVVAEGMKEVDLGFKKLEAEAVGAELGAVIARLEDSGEEEQTLDLKVALSKDAVQGLRLLDASGTEIPLRECGYSSSSEECTLTYTVQGKAPAKGRLLVRVYAGMKEVEIPFTLTDVDFRGQTR
jgi:hypothetical protein